VHVRGLREDDGKAKLVVRMVQAHIRDHAEGVEVHPNDSLMKQIALNKEELTTIFNRTPDLTGLN
jgi:hypothetical protein